MPMDQIEKVYTQGYGNLITMLAQQTKSKLESCVISQGGIKGKAATAADQIGEFQLNDVVNRLADTALQDIDRDRRWYEPRTKRGCVPIDNIDAIRTTLDPKSQIVLASMAGVNRAKDAEIVRGYYATNKTGENGEVSTSFDSNNVISSSYGSGDIIKQLNHGLTLFAKNKVDIESEEIYCVINSVAAEKLRQAGVYTSADYMNDKVLGGKKLAPYCGINFIQYEAVPSYEDSGTIYKLPFFVKTGVGLGKWEDMLIKVEQLQHKNYAWSVFVEMSLGASRLEEAKCLSLEVK
ncbi:MAG: hypothetical protein II972_02215 [Elusimicrobiaceae bacterium]|nr:hypothetical protein [Elusimicrobiaceae bacterium]